MCDICQHFICPSACPNSPEPIHVFECSGCGYSIYEGDDYWDIMGEQWCKECVEDARREAVYEPD